MKFGLHKRGLPGPPSPEQHLIHRDNITSNIQPHQPPSTAHHHAFLLLPPRWPSPCPWLKRLVFLFHSVRVLFRELFPPALSFQFTQHLPSSSTIQPSGPEDRFAKQLRAGSSSHHPPPHSWNPSATPDVPADTPELRYPSPAQETRSTATIKQRRRLLLPRSTTEPTHAWPLRSHTHYAIRPPRKPRVPLHPGHHSA